MAQTIDFTKGMFSKLWKVYLLAAIVAILIAFFSFFLVVVEVGTVGVVNTFGAVDNTPFYPGIHVKNPFSSVTLLNTRITTYTMSGTYGEGEVVGDDSIQVLAKDGGTVWFDVSVMYQLDPTLAPQVYSKLGSNYSETIIRPEIRSVIREVSSQYTVYELYSDKREEFQNEVFDEIKSRIGNKGIILDSVLLRKVSISQTLSDSIEKKLATEQDVQRLAFEVQKAKQDAERKIVEAEGQKKAQEIINSSLTKNYLLYLYISQLKDRAGTIYVPIDPQNGFPMFKNVE